MNQTTVKTNDRYNWYAENYNNPVNKSVYGLVCWELNQEVLDYILLGEGRKFEFGSKLGHLIVYKFPRDIRIVNGRLIAPPDWGKTRKLKAEGKLDKGKVVYITDPYYIGFKWVKEHCNVKGQHAYKFNSSRTNGKDSISGAKNKLTSKLKDPLYHFKFPFIKEK